MLLEAQNLRVQYRGGALGILDVSFRVDRGQIVTLFGPNGAGKTTSIRAISGFLRSEGAKVVSGEVRLDGTNVTRWEPHRLYAAGISVVPERNKIFPNLSVTENLKALGKRRDRHKRQDDDDHVFDLFPVLKDRGRTYAGTLSGGQQQMLAIARGMMNSPSLLIIDEMTLGLHHSVHRPLFDVISKIASGGTAILIVDEDIGLALEMAQYCNFLANGIIVDHGEPARFRRSETRAARQIGEP